MKTDLQNFLIMLASGKTDYKKEHMPQLGVTYVTVGVMRFEFNKDGAFVEAHKMMNS